MHECDIKKSHDFKKIDFYLAFETNLQCNK